MKMANGAFAYANNTIFYGNAPTYYDVSVDATSTFEYSADCLFYNQAMEFLGTITRLSMGNMIANDSNVTGISIKDALNTLLGMVNGNIEIFPIGLAGVSAFKVVYIDTNGKINHASASDTDTSSIVGITLEGGNSGENATVAKLGSVTNPAWTLIITERYYLGEDGELTDVMPTVGFICEVGLAQSATELEIQNLDDITVIV